MADEETTETTSEETAAAQTEEETTTSEETTSTEKEPDWKTQSRKHERRAKKAADDLTAAQERIKELEQAGASEQEKAVAAAREEAAKEAKAEVLTELRGDRLEVAVARLANGIKITDGDEEKTARFADPDDALLRVERAIKRGDLDQDDIFDSQGKVQTDALTVALREILEQNSHLQATNGDGRRASGESDAGKGAGGSKSMEDMTVDEHLKRKQESRN